MEQFRRHVVRMRCHQAVRTPTISQGACAGMKSGASGGGVRSGVHTFAISFPPIFFSFSNSLSCAAVSFSPCLSISSNIT